MRQPICGTEHDRTLDHISQFPDIARPVIGYQIRDRRRMNVTDRLAELAREASQEMPRQNRDILFTLPQRGHAQRHDVQSIEQVFSKLASVYARLKVLVG